MRLVFTLLAMIGLCSFPIAAVAAGLFESDQPIGMTLTAPLKALISDRNGKPKYRDASLSYIDQDGVTHTLDIKVRPRGLNRRKPSVCRLPPLRLNIRKQSAAGTVFEGQQKLKLVTHCQDRKKEYQQYVLKEYLVYKILNLLTEQSFRVQLLNVTYKSTDSNRKPQTGYAFLIEDRKQMAKRSGLRFRAVQNIGRHELDAQAASVVEVFQYMVGNTDFSILDAPGDRDCCHNAVLISAKGEPYVPVPYDFDFSGVVDASYAIPFPRTRSVRTRVYRGFCRPPEILQATLTRFREQRDAIYDLFRQQEGLSETAQRKALSYLDEFYTTINDPDRLQRKILKSCR